MLWFSSDFASDNLPICLSLSADKASTKYVCITSLICLDSASSLNNSRASLTVFPIISSSLKAVKVISNSLSGSVSPPVSSPPVSLSPFSSPPVSLSPFSSPPVSLSPVSSPPVSSPPVCSPPPVSSPPVSSPPVSSPPISGPFSEISGRLTFNCSQSIVILLN